MHVRSWQTDSWLTSCIPTIHCVRKQIMHPDDSTTYRPKCVMLQLVLAPFIICWLAVGTCQKTIKSKFLVAATIANTYWNSCILCFDVLFYLVLALSLHTLPNSMKSMKNNKGPSSFFCSTKFKISRSFKSLFFWIQLVLFTAWYIPACRHNSCDMHYAHCNRVGRNICFSEFNRFNLQKAGRSVIFANLVSVIGSDRLQWRGS